MSRIRKKGVQNTNLPRKLTLSDQFTNAGASVDAVEWIQHAIDQGWLDISQVGNGGIYDGSGTVPAGVEATITDFIRLSDQTTNNVDLVLGDGSYTGFSFPWIVRLAAYPNGAYNDLNNTHFRMFATDFSTVVPGLDTVWGIGYDDGSVTGIISTIDSFGDSSTGLNQMLIKNHARGGDGTGTAIFQLDQQQHGTAPSTVYIGSHIYNATNSVQSDVDILSRHDGTGPAQASLQAVRTLTGDSALSDLYAENIADGLIMQVAVEVASGTKRVIIGENGSGTEYFLPGVRGNNGEALISDGAGNLTFQAGIGSNIFTADLTATAPRTHDTAGFAFTLGDTTANQTIQIGTVAGPVTDILALYDVGGRNALLNLGLSVSDHSAAGQSQDRVFIGSEDGGLNTENVASMTFNSYATGVGTASVIAKGKGSQNGNFEVYTEALGTGNARVFMQATDGTDTVELLMSDQAFTIDTSVGTGSGQILFKTNTEIFELQGAGVKISDSAGLNDYGLPNARSGTADDVLTFDAVGNGSFSSVVDILSGYTITTATVAGTDKVVIQDTDDSDNVKTVTAQAVADLKVTELSEDTTPVLGGPLNGAGQAITNANIDSGTIDGTNIGSSVEGTVACTTSIASVGFQATGTAVTATGAGAAIAANTSMVIQGTTTDANDILVLPAAVQGMQMTIITNGTGCELRSDGDGSTINNVDCGNTTPVNELALAASSMFVCVATSTTAWIVRGFDNVGADLAALVPDAV